jgi:hypothetical protein
LSTYRKYEYLDEDAVVTSDSLSNAVALPNEKLITYFTKLVTDPKTSLYCVATALHPRLRLLWFQSHWKKFPE